MADKRINALANTASSTASDDFIAVDGTTNGTRKLSAFSPTFGGNATVTGTLTVNGATAFIGANTGSPYVLIKGGSSGTNGGGSLVVENGSGGSVIGIGNVSAIAGGAYNNDPVLWYAGSESLRFYNASTEVANFSSTGVLSLLATTASTTTSTGALVVGNGTSGGLGVGGAASIGGPILVGTSSDVYLSRVGTGILDIRSASSPGTAARLDVTGTTSAGLGLRQTGTRDWFISAESSELRVSCLTAASIFAFNSGTPVAMRDTTASTSTSSGALVVSGGVGVAGAGNFGGAVGVGGATVASRLHVYESTSGTGDSNGITIEQASTADAALQFLLTGVQRWTVGIDNSDSDKFKIGTGAIGSADRLTIDTSGNLVAGGSVQTAAPSGGTAAAWKLGTVATVSPTSPNRTIEVDIGGTIYYIHAKTTNN